MKKINLVILWPTLLVYLLLSTSSYVALAEESSELTEGAKRFDPNLVKKDSSYDLKELVLPSEVSNLPKQSGSIYYSKGSKEKALIAVNFWGEVGHAGLYYIPIDTNLVRGLSLAGGSSGNANTNSIYVTRREESEYVKYQFDLGQGGSDDAIAFTLKPDDIVYIPRSRFYENRAYYTALISVAVTVLSGIVIYQKLNSN